MENKASLKGDCINNILGFIFPNYNSENMNILCDKNSSANSIGLSRHLLTVGETGVFEGEASMPGLNQSFGSDAFIA